MRLKGSSRERLGGIEGNEGGENGGILFEISNKLGGR